MPLRRIRVCLSIVFCASANGTFQQPGRLNGAVFLLVEPVGHADRPASYVFTPVTIMPTPSKSAVREVLESIRLKESSAPQSANEPDAGRSRQRAGSTAGMVDYAKCRLVWDATKTKVAAELKKLEHAITEVYGKREGFPQIAGKLRKLDGVLDAFADDLSGLFNRLAAGPQASDRDSLHREAARLVRFFHRQAVSDPFIGELDSNPFVPVTIRATLERSLTDLSGKLR